jgi:Domain of unknown function (DUF309)
MQSVILLDESLWGPDCVAPSRWGLDHGLIRWTQTPFPPSSYVPGQSSKQRGDRESHGRRVSDSPDERGSPNATRFSLSAWRTSQAYLYAIDLFNAGYYWEAHEEWEGAWHSAGRTTPDARFVQGLIKLAACGVKAREGQPVGIRRHALRAVEVPSRTRRLARIDVGGSSSLNWSRSVSG